MDAGSWSQSTSSGTQSPADILKSLNYRHGHIDLRQNIAVLDVPAGYAYLDPADTETFLTKICTVYLLVELDTDGMIFPEGIDPRSADGWAVVITYDDSGHVSDSDAASTNFDDLLKTMQKRASDFDPDRQKKGYPTIELRGWAEPPHYDSAAKTVYWAEQFRFGSDAQDTLTYRIRILGREGVLELNVIEIRPAISTAFGT